MYEMLLGMDLHIVVLIFVSVGSLCALLIASAAVKALVWLERRAIAAGLMTKRLLTDETEPR